MGKGRFRINFLSDDMFTNSSSRVFARSDGRKRL